MPHSLKKSRILFPFDSLSSPVLSSTDMGTVVLRSHDPLRHQQFFASPKFHRSNQTRSRRRKRSPTAGRQLLASDSPPSLSLSLPAKTLVMGQVRILKRGENLRPSMSTLAGPSAGARDDLILCSSDRLGPDTEVVRRQIRVSDLYAGAACLPSPPPSSLPFPAALVRGGGRRVVSGGC